MKGRMGMRSIHEPIGVVRDIFCSDAVRVRLHIEQVNNLFLTIKEFKEESCLFSYPVPWSWICIPAGLRMPNSVGFVTSFISLPFLQNFLVVFL